VASDVRGVLRIDDPEVDVEAIVERIRRNLDTRDPLEVDTAALLRRFGGELSQPSAYDLDYAVECLRLILDTPIPSQRIRPIRTVKDKLLNRLRRPLHDLVRFYVDAQAARQTEIARLVHGALVALRTRETGAGSGTTAADPELIARLDALADDAAAMRDELRALHDELALLRASLPAQP
jgi:hypothetical protein